MVLAACRPPFMTVAMWFAWLLREDVRAGSSITDPAGQRAFVSWWMLFGAIEYPKVWWYGLKQVRVAMASVLGPSGHRIPSLLLRLHQARNDLQQQFNLTDPEQLGNYFCWYRLDASHDLLAAPALPSWAMALTEAASRQYASPTVARMALALWSRSDELRLMMDLEQPGARRGLDHWYKAHGLRWIPKPSPRLATPEVRPVRRSSTWSLARSPVSLVGFAKAEFGLGEDIRILSRALEARAVDHTITDMNVAGNVRTQDGSRVAWLAPPSHGITIFCMTTFDAAERFLIDGPMAFENAYNVGYWPWELPRFPTAWSDVYGLMDEVWAATRFQEEAYKADDALPVFLMPPAITPALSKIPPKSAAALSRRFRFLYVFDPNSTLARKNPLAAVRAFQLAFPVALRSSALLAECGPANGHPCHGGDWHRWRLRGGIYSCHSKRAQASKSIP